MKRQFLFLAIVLPLSVISCSKENIVDMGPELVVYDSLEVYATAGGMTIGASVKDLTEITATFYGEVAKDSLQMTAKSYGFLYASAEEDSLTVKNSTKVVIKKLDENNCFESIESKLAPGASYIWTVFVENEGEYTLGEVKEFQTLELVAPQVKEVTVTPETATFEGTVTLLQAETKKMEVGILYSESRKDLKNYEGEEFVIEDISKRGKFSATLRGLEPGTSYYFMPYISVNKAVAYGEIGDFTTAAPPVYGADVAGIDLSDAAKAPANCYIVSGAGQYKFPAIMGNGEEYVSGGAKAEVLWESFGTAVSPNMGDLVTNAGFKNNYVSFEVPKAYKEGNAVIAVRNSAGKILWSWHIWLTDQPAECVLPNGAGTIMDRNLGAVDKAADRIESYGLLYQWGRKDPFMGEAGWNYVHTASSVGAEWTKNAVEIQGEDYWIANPMDYTAWDVFDETLWDPDKKKRQDPCPAGWRVPACNENDNFWASVAGCLNNSSAFKSTEYGLTLTISNPSTWFPYVGWGTDPFYVTESGGHGYYWLAYFHNQSYAIHNYSDPVLKLEDKWYYHLNCAVRCIKE